MLPHVGAQEGVGEGEEEAEGEGSAGEPGRGRGAWDPSAGPVGISDVGDSDPGDARCPLRRSAQRPSLGR